MPPLPLIDLEQVDLSVVRMRKVDIYGLLPHRHEFELLDGVCHIDKNARSIVTFSDIREDAWWVRGHIPGQPLLPGVLMLEMAGHAASLLAKLLSPSESFIGLAGVDRAKFRDTITPPGRLYVIAVSAEQRPRRIVCQCQGVSEGKLIFEARVTGIVLR